MNKQRNSVFLVLGAAVLLSLIWCGCGDEVVKPSYDVTANLKIAWDSFEKENYDQAISKFSEVLSNSANNAEALMGRGWCHAFNREYSPAITDLNASIQQKPDSDAEMGLAAAYRDVPFLEEAIIHATAVIEADSEYVFSKRPTIDYKDAHLIRAQCYFRQGNNSFPSAHFEVNYLCGKLGISPLAPPESFSSAAEYERELGQKLEDLSARL